jgi:hypothetical protein
MKAVLLLVTVVSLGAVLAPNVPAQERLTVQPRMSAPVKAPHLFQTALAVQLRALGQVGRHRTSPIVEVQTPGGPHVSSRYCTYRAGEDCCCEFWGGDNPPAHMCMTPSYCATQPDGGGKCVEGQAGRQPC